MDNFHQTFSNKTTRNITITFVLCVALIIVFSISTLIFRSGKIKITIAYQPTETQVFINHQSKNVNNSTLYLPAGDYEISAFLDGYIYQSSQISINEHNANLVGQLIPIDASDDEVANYLSQLSIDTNIAQSDSIEQLYQQFPLLNYIPYSTPDGPYAITYDFNASYTTLNVYLDLTEHNDLTALRDACIRLKSFNPDISIANYNITITNFDNPFEDNFQDNSNTNPVTFLQTGFRSIANLHILSGATSGDYYYTIIEQPITNSTNLSYRVILRRSGNSWTLASTPSPILTTHNTPNVPVEIIDLANRREDE